MVRNEELAPEHEVIFSLSCSIGITGENHAAGSSTVAKLLASVLDLPYLSAGNILRRIAKMNCDGGDSESNLYLLGQWLSKDPGRDAKIDRIVVGRAFQKPVVFDGKKAVDLARRGLIPNRDHTLMKQENARTIFSVKLRCTEEESAVRALFRDWCTANKKDPGKLSSDEVREVRQTFTRSQIETKKEDLKQRMASGNKRWEASYNLGDDLQYDLEIDTTELAPVDIVVLIIKELRSKDIISEKQQNLFFEKLERL